MKTLSLAAWSARSRRGAACLALVLSAACGGGGDFMFGVGNPTTGIGGGDRDATAAIVGTWTSIVTFSDAGGVVHQSETIWRFGSDGNATRTAIATNLTYGYYDVTVIAARWRVTGSIMEITYLAPTVSVARFDYRVDRDRLVIGTTVFVRLPP